jgi:hypothetical protein
MFKSGRLWILNLSLKFSFCVSRVALFINTIIPRKLCFKNPVIRINSDYRNDPQRYRNDPQRYRNDPQQSAIIIFAFPSFDQYLVGHLTKLAIVFEGQ